MIEAESYGFLLVAHESICGPSICLSYIHPYFSVILTITFVIVDGFSANLVCALILWRAGFGLLTSKFRQFLTEESVRHTIVAGYFFFHIFIE